jgi:hypothetical protein
MPWLDGTEKTITLKLRPYHEWPLCYGHPKPDVFPALAKILERGTITVVTDPIENKGQWSEGGIYALPKCDSPLFWRIAEPDLVGYVCRHFLEHSQPLRIEDEPEFKKFLQDLGAADPESRSLS